MKKIISLILALALLAVPACLMSCGDKKDDVKDKDDNAPVEATKVIDINLTEEDYAFGVDKAQPELLEQVNAFVKKIKENGTLDEICEKYFSGGEPTPVTSAALDESKDQLVVATNAAFAPFEYTEGDKFLGIDMEIAKLLADELGKELVIQHMDFEAVCLSVGQHKCDIAMAGLTVNEEREEHVTFSEPYYAASQKLIVKGDDTTFDKCKTVEDVEKILNGFDKKTKVGVQDGTTGQLYCAGDEDWGFAGFAFETVGYKNGSLAVQDMINGNIDYVVIDAAPADFISASINKMN